MLGVERRQKIMEKLQLEQKVYVSELSKLFGITEETVRRDLEKLEAENLLRRSYGGATLAEHTSEDLSFIRRSAVNSAGKEAIAQKAAQLIHDGDTIMVDSSTTCMALFKVLQNKKDLTIITNSIRLIHRFLNAPFKFISTGGTLRPNSGALTGAVAYDTLRRYFVDRAVISCKGLDQTKGIMESNEEESVIKQVMIAQAKETMLLADHSKFGRTAFTQTCDIARVATIVTDRPPDAGWQTFIAEKGIELVD